MKAKCADGPEQAQSLRHFHWLDSIRFIAALLVLVGHARYETFVEFGALSAADKTLYTGIAYEFSRLGDEGLAMFFVLSGFLVGGRALERIASGSFRPVDFTIDRLVRIMLPLIPALVLTAIVQLVRSQSINVMHLLGNLIGLQGVLVPPCSQNEPLWTLSYELWFYVLTWIVGVMAINRHHLQAGIMLIILALVFTSLKCVFLFCWLIGVFFYICRPTKHSPGMMLCSVGLCLFSIAVHQIAEDSASISLSIKHYMPSLDASRIILSASLAFLMQQLVIAPPKKKVLTRFDQIGTRLAASSYSLYITHYPVLHLMVYLGLKRASHVNLTTISIFFAVVLFCYLVSWFFYQFFEKHTNIVRKLIKNGVNSFIQSVPPASMSS